MKRRYILAPEAADLVEIWRYIKRYASIEMADRVESVIREKIALKFFSAFSYLIVYRPETRPLQVVAILHGLRDVEQLLKDRL